MVGQNKILTVSYGTFSCTLEGFDDPFATMRGIAEYFRDLAADDRYFGAEPPTPDAEVLHRIAEREVQRRVEARVEHGGVVLRQAEDQPTALAPEPAPQPAPEVTQPAPAPAAAAAVAPAAAPRSETVAERLARIRAVVAQNENDSGDAEEIAESAELTAAFAEPEEEAETTELEVAEAEAPEAVEEITEPEVPAEAAAEEEAEEPVAEEPEIAPEPFEFALTDVAAFEEEEAAEAPAEEAEESFDARAVMEALAEENVDEEASAIAAAAEAEAEFASAESDEELAEQFAEEAAEDIEYEAEEVIVATSEAEESFADFIAAQALDEDEDEDLAEAGAEAEPVTRVLKMRRADFEAAARDFDMRDEDEDDSIDLMAENEDEDFEDELPEPEATPRPATTQRRISRHPEGVEAEKTSVSRLLEQTNSEMAETEGSRRRSAIAHLKAAVAATRAERALGQGEDKAGQEGEGLEAYRDDLARAVKPRRPQGEARQAPRRMPPLMLVSEQRVDTPPAEEMESSALDLSSIRPRRISSGNLIVEDLSEPADEAENGENIFSDASSFAEFARDMGAQELPDLLEAAAAYYSYVEGQPHFSRPQIMNAVAAMNDAGDFSREEGLRSFGMLLRRGKIRKIRRGQFEIADNTRFRPELRAGE